MSHPRRLLLPWGAYGALRDQLGSVRGIYLHRDKVVRHNDLAPGDTPVLLVHGFFQTRNLWLPLEQRLRADGHKVLSFHLGTSSWRYNTRPIVHSAQHVADKFERLAEKHQLAGVHVIGHSMGGLIGRCWAQRLGGERWIRSLTTLGTPHHGTPTAALAVALIGWTPSSAWELLPRSRVVRSLTDTVFPSSIRMTSIASRHDLVCPYRYSRLDDPHRNVLVDDLGHSELAWHPMVYGMLRDAIEGHQTGAVSSTGET